MMIDMDSEHKKIQDRVQKYGMVGILKEAEELAVAELRKAGFIDDKKLEILRQKGIISC